MEQHKKQNSKNYYCDKNVNIDDHNSEFIKLYDLNDNESIYDNSFLNRFSKTEAELKETIEYLISHRLMIKETELESLEHKAKSLLKKIKEIETEKLIEEINCFKNVLLLQKKLILKDKDTKSKKEE